MQTLSAIWVAIGIMVFYGSAGAAEQVQAFAIENMDCPVCPVTVRKAIEKVAGVTEVSVDYETRTAIAAYDDVRATAEQIADASTNAGYPATPIDVSAE